MKLPKKAIDDLKKIMFYSNLSSSLVRLINTYEDSYRVYLLMLMPGIPYDVRCQAVEIFSKYINPSCALPMQFVFNILDLFDMDNYEYSETFKAIQRTKLIIY